MVTLLITSLVFLATFAVVIYFLRKPAAESARQLSDGQPRATSLFEYRTTQLALAPRFTPSFEELRARAEAGDRTALVDARRVNSDNVYEETLKVLSERCSTDQDFLSLVSFVARDENLLVTPDLASGFIERWKQHSDSISAGEMLHITALSNDASLYRSACEVVVNFFLSGRLPGVKAVDLSMLIEGEYWILSSDARASGAGFVLKRSIAEFRKQLVSRINH